MGEGCSTTPGADVVYACDVRTYSPDALDAVLGDGTILLHGGGNLGDVWPRQQRLRERCSRTSPAGAVVQLPQSIHFDEQAESIAFAMSFVPTATSSSWSGSVSRSRSRAPWDGAILCPDLAFLLGPAGETRAAAAHRHASGSPAPTRSRAEPSTRGVTGSSWWTGYAGRGRAAVVGGGDGGAGERARDHRPVRGRQLRGPGVDAALLCAYDTLAAQRVERGCRILARGRVVVADRLHGHISLAAHGPAERLLDNSTERRGAVYETWTSPCELATWADSPDEALTTARRLLSRRASR